MPGPPSRHWEKRAHACASRAISQCRLHRPGIGKSEHMHAHLARSPNDRATARPLGKAAIEEKCRPQSSEPWPDPRCCSSRRFARGLRSRSSCRRALLVVAAHVRARLHAAQFSIEKKLWLAQWRQTSTWKSCARHALPSQSGSCASRPPPSPPTLAALAAHTLAALAAHALAAHSLGPHPRRPRHPHPRPTPSHPSPP
jgi:hypothetical protein